MRTLAQVRLIKAETVKEMKELETQLNELRLKLCEQREFLRELDDLEKVFFENEAGITTCPPHDYRSKKRAGKKDKPSEIAQKFRSLSKEEQANLLQLLTLGDTDD